jgi:hypothetical protein
MQADHDAGPQPGGDPGPDGWRRALRRAARPADLPLAALLAVFLGLRLDVWARAGAVRTPDSASYVWTNGRGFDSGPLVSFTGHAPRLWGTPLLYVLLPDDPARVFAQWLIGTLAWALLAAVVWGRLRTLAGRLCGAALVLGFGLMPQVTNWDFAILSEPLSISLGVACLALLVWWLATDSLAVLTVLTVVAVWWMFVRPEIRVLAAFVVPVLAVRVLARPGRRVPALVALGVLAAGMAWVSAVTPTMGRTYGERAANGLPVQEATLAYRLRFMVMPDPEVLRVYRHDLGMPACPAAEADALLPGWHMRAFIDRYRECGDLRRWGHEHAIDSSYRFAEAAPGLFTRLALRFMPAELGGGVRVPGTDVLPPQLERAAFMPRHLVVPGLAAGLAGAVLAGVLLAATGMARGGRQRLVILAGLGTAAAGLVSAVVDLTLAAGEFDRFGAQESVAVRLGILLVVAGSVDALVAGERRRARAERLAGTGGSGGPARAGAQPAPAATPVAPPGPPTAVEPRGDAELPIQAGEPRVHDPGHVDATPARNITTAPFGGLARFRPRWCQ